MSRNTLITWVIVFAACVAWQFVGPFISALAGWSLLKIGIPWPIVQFILILLPLILLWEVVVKALIYQLALPPIKFVPTQAESLPYFNQEELLRRTTELNQLGFIKLSDYTIPPNQVGTRLFAHPQKFCFAEISQGVNLPMFCVFHCPLEENWVLAVTNFSALKVSAISRAFLRLPRTLNKRIEGASFNELLQALSSWREQACRDLDVAMLQDVSVEAYFRQEQRRRMEQRHLILRKSIIWGVLEIVWFSLKPQSIKSEWLGDYSKFKVKH